MAPSVPGPQRAAPAFEDTPLKVGPLKVGYVLKRFPRLTETFILNEILELERQGVEVDIFSLLHPPEEARHELLKSLRARVTYLPGGRLLEQWKVRTGQGDAAPAPTTIGEFLDECGLPFPELFPGRGPAAACGLYLKATTVAVLASSKGIARLHAHFGSDATTVALLASRLSGVAYSFTAHARDIYHTYVDPAADAAMRRRKINEADFVVTVSEYNRRHLIDLAGPGCAAKIHRLYNGVDLQRFRPPATAPEPGLILAVGRLIEKKGFADLVEACRNLRDRGVSFRCAIVGEGPLRGALERQIAAAGLTQVHLLGARPQEEVLEFMARATAVVLPCVVSASGDRDGLPTVLLEAMASGVPTISTTVAGVPEIIDHERNGLLVPPNDPPALAGAIDALLFDPELRKRMGPAARSKAERDFDLRSNVAILKSYFCSSALRHEAILRGAG